MERGNQTFDCGYMIQEGALASGDALSFKLSLDSQLENLPVGEYPFTMTQIRVVSSGMDVTDSYDISQVDAATDKDHEATLTVAPKEGNFTIVIPPTVSVNDGSMTIECTQIDSGLTVGGKVASEGNFTLSCPENGKELSYELYRGGAKLSDGDVAAEFTQEDSQALNLRLADGVQPTSPGFYTDALTFTALIQ